MVEIFAPEAARLHSFKELEHIVVNRLMARCVVQMELDEELIEGQRTATLQQSVKHIPLTPLTVNLEHINRCVSQHLFHQQPSESIVKKEEYCMRVQQPPCCTQRKSNTHRHREKQLIHSSAVSTCM